LLQVLTSTGLIDALKSIEFYFIRSG